MARLNVVKSFRGTTKTDDGCLTCQSCHDKICKGDGYRWWANRVPGARGSFRNIRCMKSECTPTVADMTPGRRGQLLQIQQEGEKKVYAWDGNDASDLVTIAENVAQEMKDLSEDMNESAQNIEEGFGHPTSTSEELEDRARALEEYADEIEQFDPDEKPDIEEFVTDDMDEEDRADAEEQFNNAVEAWQDEQRDKLTELINEADVY